MAVKTNCVINGIPYYRIRKKIGEDLNGKSIIKPFYGKGKQEAEEMVKDYLANQKAGIKNDKEHFSQLIDFWIKNVMKKSNLSDGTKTRYDSAYKTHIINTGISYVLMKDITSRLIQKYYNDLTDKGKPVEMINKVLSLFFKYAEAEGYCRNPLNNVTVKKNKVSDGKIVVFTHEEVKKILNSPKDTIHSQYRMAYILALGTGIRMGELIALKWSDIKDNNLSVTKQAIYNIDGVLKIDNVKTANSVRVIPIPDYVAKELEEYKVNHTGKYIFETSTGTLVDKSNLRITYKRFLKSIGVTVDKEKPKSFHTLRKTYCTMLCENGIPIQTASVLMGHSSIAVTAKYYTFISGKEKTEAAEKLSEVFSEIQGLKKG